MLDYPDKNKQCWTDWSQRYEPGARRAWSRSNIGWGIFDIPETEAGGFDGFEDWSGQKVIELGCGTAYFGAWLARRGALVTGIDITPAQLELARGFQAEFGIEFPLIEGNAEDVPLPDGSFDWAVSEYGASIWCDPYRWIPEAARLLRPGGRLVFLRNGILSMLCSGDSGPVSDRLMRDYFGMYRLEFDDADGNSVEFQIPTGEMIKVLRDSGFDIDALIELQAPAENTNHTYDYMPHGWARRWPSEEIWRARKR